MTPAVFLKRVVDDSLQYAAPIIGIPVSDNARVLLMAIAGQESGWQYRRQFGGPARSYWQFERGGGVAGLFSVTPAQLRAICGDLDIPFVPDTVFEAMAWCDPLACAMARLLLWSDPAPLPAVGDKQGGWEYYLRNWRPGAPHPDAWGAIYDQSLALIHS